MGTEVVTLKSRSVCHDNSSTIRGTHLSLQDVGRDDLAPVAVEEGKGRAECWRGDTPDGGLSDDTPPARLSLVNSLVEEVVEQERLELGVGLICVCDITEEDRLDNASSTPDTSDTSIVQSPVELCGTST